MISLNYNARVVLGLFTQAKPGKLDPSADDIQKFDKQLKSAFEDALQRLMGQAGIPFTVPNKSQVLAYRPNMPGTDDLQIQNACTFFKNTSDIFESAGAAPEALSMVGPKKAGAKKKAPKKKATRKKATRKKG